MVNPYPIDPLELDRFLQEQGLETIVGISCDDGNCPLARYLNTLYPGSSFFVHTSEYRRCMDDISLGAERDATFALEPWAQLFVRLVDESGSLTDDLPVTAFDALWCLRVACNATAMPIQEG